MWQLKVEASLPAVAPPLTPKSRTARAVVRTGIDIVRAGFAKGRGGAGDHEPLCNDIGQPSGVALRADARASEGAGCHVRSVKRQCGRRERALEGGGKGGRGRGGSSGRAMADEWF
jgi:hypothetical protein